jgi:hypothetical protein
MAVRCTTVCETREQAVPRQRGAGLPIYLLELTANGEPMDKEESLHEPMVEWRQQDSEPGARPNQGGGDKATVGASQANGPLLDRRLAGPHQTQATSVRAPCFGRHCDLRMYSGVWHNEWLVFDVFLTPTPRYTPDAPQYDS